MKCTKLIIKNIGKVADMTVPIDKPLLLFYGEIRQGKTTILNAVRWVCGGEFPSDIIRHGQDEGSITLEFDGGVISRSWYRGKGEDKSIKARPVTFIRDGKPVLSPVSEIKRFLNPFLINQDHLRNMTETERKQYFSELFAVDTTELDKEWVNNDREARSLRVKIGGYGDIDLTEYKPVDVAAEQAKLAEIRAAHSAALESVSAANRKVIEHNATFDQGTQKLSEAVALVTDLETRLNAAREQKAKIDKWLTEHPRQSEQAVPAAPDTAALEKTISDAGATNVRAEQYQKNLDRAKLKKADEKQVKTYEARQRTIKDEKRAKLKTVSDSCGIPNLEFDEEGNFTYEGCQAGMLSTSQIMKLSSELSALYPEGFGLQLLDRAESLGKSIFEFVERAKKEKTTILATIVGERPATTPPDIGVFVVNDGKLDEAPE